MGIKIVNNARIGHPARNNRPEPRPRDRSALTATVEPFTKEPTGPEKVIPQASRITADPVVLNMAPEMTRHMRHHGSAPFNSQGPQTLAQQFQLLAKPLPLCLAAHRELSSTATADKVREAQEGEGCWAP
jgi:hypothetical protein